MMDRAGSAEDEVLPALLCHRQSVLGGSGGFLWVCGARRGKLAVGFLG